MQVRIANQKEFAAGALFVAIGVIWGLASLRLALGQATRMGPGYFPLCVSIALVGIGIIAMARSVRSPEQARLGHFPLMSFLFLLGGVAGFGLLVRTAGLVAASLFVVACCCHRLWLERPLEALAITIGFTAVAVLIFVKGLGLPIGLF